MKKFTLFLAVFLAFSGYTMAQVIDDFENPESALKIQSQNPDVDKSSFSFVANPDPKGINTSSTVLKFVRDKDETGWNGFLCPVTPFKIENIYVHMKVWKPRLSVVWFGFLGDYGEYAVAPMKPQTVVNGWEELVFSFTGSVFSGMLEFFPYPWNDGLTEDVTMYIDDITINHNPAVGSEPEKILMDFESIPLNLMLGGAEDLSTMTISANPDSLGVNQSSSVVKFLRDKDGVPWGGFWSTLPAPIDLTTNKFMHVKVWKPRISPVKFKIEGGAAGNLEVESKYPQTKINEWEDMVFDFSSKTGAYPTIALMPDFEDPLTLTEDITIYFDDIVLNNDSLPRAGSEVFFNVDMTDAGLTAGQKVYISGNFGGIYGNWADPGTLPGNEMTDPDGNGIYTIKMNLLDGTVNFRFYKGTGTTNGDFGPSERTWTVSGSANLTYKWQLGGLLVSADALRKLVFSVDMIGAGPMGDQKVYISGTFGGIHGIWAMPGTNPENEMTDSDGDGKYSITLNLPDGIYYFKFFRGNGWGGGEWPGDPNRSYTVTGNKTIDFGWGGLGMRGKMNEYNLITDGQFNIDGSIIPSPEFLPTWLGWTDNSGKSVKVTNGILTIKNNEASPLSPWNLGVHQYLNDFGKMLYNDSTYLLFFDAWANKERVFTIDLEDNWYNNFTRFGLSSDVDAVYGRSQWDVNLTTTRTTYIRKVKMDAIKPSSSFHCTIQAAADTGIVYLDNIYLISENDLWKYGEVSGITVAGEGGATSIAADKGTLQMNAVVLPADAWIKDVVWSVINGTGNAVIASDGLLTAVTDGKVTVVASSRDGSNKSDSLEITISNQVRPGLPIDFENIHDFAWNVFGNGTDLYGQFSMVVNPNITKNNPSAHTLKFIVNSDAEVYSGASSEAFGPLEFTCFDYIINLLVKKSVKCTVGVKVEQSTNGGPDTLVTVSSSSINAWQKLKFDFSDCAGYTYQKITIYPDIREIRTGFTTVYLDNIALVKSSTSACTVISSNKNNTIKIYPNPVRDQLNVYLNSANARLAIYNSLGCKIEEVNVTETHTRIDVSHYAQGVYFLKINDGTVVKFVK